MAYSNILVISDNPGLTAEFLSLFNELGIDGAMISLACSTSSSEMLVPGKFSKPVLALKVKELGGEIAKTYDLVFSIHCKQLFPPDLVNGTKCINVHPGLNPFNRGWFPQVFAIMNGMPHGATIHEIDVELDHGPIIDQQMVSIFAHDTSLSAYNRVVAAEKLLLRRNLKAIVSGTYETFKPDVEGNLNSIKDFRSMLKLDLSEKGDMKYFLNKFRALTHGDYKNAYFLDPESGKKVYVNIKLQPEQND
ncbi:MAG: methionyl-tRNA formyltransferase [Bacteroidia bacterium]|jgi:methionyl-tRNA formyltransferase